jgi:hypothetical protein
VSEGGPPGRFEWERALLASDVAGNALLVLLALGTYMDRRGAGAHPGATRLSADTGLGISTVRRHLSDSTRAGWLRRTTRGGRRGHVRTSAEYASAIPSQLLMREHLGLTPTAQSEGSNCSLTAPQLLTSEHPPPIDHVSTTTTEEAVMLEGQTKVLYDALNDAAQEQVGRRLIPTGDLIRRLEQMTDWPPSTLASMPGLWTNWRDVQSPSDVLAYRLAGIADRPRPRNVPSKIDTTIECDHGQPGGCAFCYACKVGRPDVDGIVCRQCTAAAAS